MYKKVKVIVMLIITSLMFSCTSYQYTAKVHSTESTREFGTPLKKTIATMPNGKTYMFLSSSYYDGSGSLTITRLKGEYDTSGHNFKESGGLLRLSHNNEHSIKVGDDIYQCKERMLDGDTFFQARVHRRVSLARD